MPGENHACLRRYLERGDCFLGQVRISSHYVLEHRDEASPAQARVFHDPHDAIEIARYDDAGQYRPLKTAPNLRRGWKLELTSLDQVLLALDFLYPAALGTARHFAAASLAPVALRSTLDRQTGMYAVVRKITDEQACDLIAETCNHQSGCLKKILWPIAPGTASPLMVNASSIPVTGPEIPLLCAEACNLLVAAGRKVVKTHDKHTGG